MAHQKEKGAVIGYVLVGALLTTALAGGVYVMCKQLRPMK